MKKAWYAALVSLASASLGLAQLDSNSITIDASRAIGLQADQAVFSLDVKSGLDVSLDDVLAALEGSGITMANLSSIRGQGPSLLPATTNDRGLVWVFNVTVPLNRITAETASLTALQRTISIRNNGLSLSFDVMGSQVSPQRQQPDQCPIEGLLADALSQARKLGEAAGVSVGPVIALSDGSSSPGSYFGLNSYPGIGFAIQSSGASSIGAFRYVNPPRVLFCFISVKFQLLRYQ